MNTQSGLTMPGLSSRGLAGLKHAANRSTKIGLDPIKLGAPGKCGDIPTHMVLCFDDSGSMSMGNDSAGRRYDEASLVIKKVAEHCKCKKCVISIIHFDPRSQEDHFSFLRLREDERTIHGALRPGGTGSSNLGPALQNAYKIVAKQKQYHNVLVVLSDFELFDPAVEHVLERFAAFPGASHAVIMRSQNAAPSLDTDLRVTVTRIENGTPHGAVAHAIFDGVTTFRPNRKLAGIPKKSSSNA